MSTSGLFSFQPQERADCTFAQRLNFLCQRAHELRVAVSNLPIPRFTGPLPGLRLLTFSHINWSKLTL